MCQEQEEAGSLKDLESVRAAIREWSNAEKRNGPKSVDLPDIVEMLIATGMRLGELLALRWSDIELTAPPERRNDKDWFAWLMINGQITSKGKRVDYGKTDAAIRPIALPDWAAALLRRAQGRPAPHRPRRSVHHPQRHVALPHSRPGPAGISATSTTTPTLPLQDVSPHSFRRTVAAEMDEVYDAEAAMNQLGHTSKTVTERHYINQKFVVPDYRAATERLAPDSGTSKGPEPGL